MKYIPVCIHRTVIWGAALAKSAPMVFMCTYPLMPKVEGNIHDTTFQKTGTEASGHEIPLMKSNGSEVNTNSNMHVSRLRTTAEAVMAKKMHASM